MRKDHPLARFSHCPCCGSPQFEVHDERAKHCADCGFTYYANAACATAAIILNEREELLAVRRALPPAAGTLDLPGGFVNPGETAEAGIQREVREETGGECLKVDYLFSLPNMYEFSNFIVHTTDLFFRCTLRDVARLSPADDAAELLWVPVCAVCPADFGLPSIRAGVNKWLKMYHSNQ